MQRRTWAQLKKMNRPHPGTDQNQQPQDKTPQTSTEAETQRKRPRPQETTGRSQRDKKTLKAIQRTNQSPTAAGTCGQRKPAEGKTFKVQNETKDHNNQDPFNRQTQRRGMDAALPEKPRKQGREPTAKQHPTLNGTGCKAAAPQGLPTIQTGAFPALVRAPGKNA
ncbi:hypothetical protein NDU88_007332 [Pleurodeles waltl]|uniref:Uncharacterized protein n=1 Tax=Pleurodeles waltl TaxID=8319 RepID=A0AAV7PKY2_PLEWA|nr:hypothetical protein NDU88_007332 [Pleurodeles waltl]